MFLLKFISTSKKETANKKWLSTILSSTTQWVFLLMLNLKKCRRNLLRKFRKRKLKSLSLSSQLSHRRSKHRKLLYLNKLNLKQLLLHLLLLSLSPSLKLNLLPSLNLPLLLLSLKQLHQVKLLLKNNLFLLCLLLQQLQQRLFLPQMKKFTKKSSRKFKKTTRDKVTTILIWRECTLIDRKWTSIGIGISNMVTILTSWGRLDSSLILKNKLALIAVLNLVSKMRKAQLYSFSTLVLSRDALALSTTRKEKSKNMNYSNRDTACLFSNQTKTNNFSTPNKKT